MSISGRGDAAAIIARLAPQFRVKRPVKPTPTIDADFPIQFPTTILET
jgi:hypothetical protein